MPINGRHGASASISESEVKVATEKQTPSGEARQFAEQIYAVLNIGGAVKLPNSTVAVLEERLEFFARQRTKKLEAALRKYGVHAINCDVHFKWYSKPCNCGFEAALEEAGREDV